jgi:hypothetical protein
VQKRSLKVILSFAAVLAFGAISFFAGTVVGSSSMEVSLLVDRDESVNGRLAVYETSEWDGFEVASAICATRTDLDRFTHTYAYFGTGLHMMFTCDEPEKET